jgi:hypothetical protein
MKQRFRRVATVFAAVSMLVSIGVARAQEDSVTLRFMHHEDRVLITIPGGRPAPVVEISQSQVARLRSIFMTLECRVNPECHWLLPRGLEMPALLSPDELKRAMVSGGDELFTAFRGHLASARHVVFEINWSMLKWPLDLLYFKKQPLFLTKEVSYRVGSAVSASQSTISRASRGLLISDVTADPQRAIFDIAQYFPRADRLDVGDVNRRRLSSMTTIDFLAISAHGHIDAGPADSIRLHGEEWIVPQDLARLKPKLVYFDSCRLGISAEFLRALQEVGTKAVLAPVLSNEAGNSSTETISVVFREVSSGRKLPAALFAARTRLYETYRQDDVATRLWRAYPFRLYNFN